MSYVDATSIGLRGLIARREPDRELLAAALDGDAVAFSEVYRRFHSRIHGFCLARLNDAEGAADATQEVFLRALRGGPAQVENPSAWLFTIARNVVVDSVRAAKRRPIASEIGEDAEVLGGQEAAGVHDGVETGEDVREVMLAMRALAPRYRSAIVMRDIKGLSSAEAAAELHTTTGALDTLLHRARRALGAEHARIEALPAACRRARALLYEPDQSAIGQADREALEVHLLGCEGCRAERTRIKRRHSLQAMLPFLFPVERGADLISRWALTFAHPMARVAALGIAAAVAVAPVGVIAVRTHSPAPKPVSVTRTAAYRHGTTVASRLTEPATQRVKDSMSARTWAKGPTGSMGPGMTGTSGTSWSTTMTSPRMSSPRTMTSHSPGSTTGSSSPLSGPGPSGTMPSGSTGSWSGLGWMR